MFASLGYILHSFAYSLDLMWNVNGELIEDIIKTETNIKEVEILDANNDFIRKKAKANFKTLGKKLGAKMKWAASEIEKFDNASIEKVMQGDFILIFSNRDTYRDTFVFTPF